MQLGFFIVTIVALSRNFRLYIVNTFLDFPLLLCYYFFFFRGGWGGGVGGRLLAYSSLDSQSGDPDSSPPLSTSWRCFSADPVLDF